MYSNCCIFIGYIFNVRAKIYCFFQKIATKVSPATGEGFAALRFPPQLLGNALRFPPQLLGNVSYPCDFLPSCWGTFRTPTISSPAAGERFVPLRFPPQLLGNVSHAAISSPAAGERFARRDSFPSCWATLIRYFTSYKEAARHPGAVDVFRIAVGTLVEVFLILVEEILDAGVHLKGYAAVNREVVGHFEVDIPEVGRFLLPVVRDIAREVLHQHTSGVSSGQRDGERPPRGEGRCQITIDIGRAEHPLLGSQALVFAPALSLLVTAALDCRPSLDLHPRIDRLGLEVDTHHAGTGTVAAFHDEVALGIIPILLQIKDIAEVGIETLDEKVGLHGAEAVVEVHRGTEALRFLFFQIGSQLDELHITPDSRHVQVFVESLRSPEAAGVREAEVNVFSRVETDVGTRTEYHMVDEVVLVEAAANQEAPAVILPLVLEEEAGDVNLLVHDAVVAHHLVFQAVVVIFQTSRKIGGHEEALIPGIGILGATDEGHVGGMAVGIGIHPSAVVTLAVGMLGRGIDIQFMLVIFGKEVVFEAAAVDVVLCLLGDVGLVGRTGDLVSASAVFVDAVILEGELGIGARFQVRAEADGFRREFAQFGIAVAVVVVGRAVASLTEDVDAGFMVVGYERGVHGRVVIRAAAANHGQRVGYLRGIPRWLLRNDIYGTRDGGCAKQGRATATHDLDALNHVRRNLLQSIDAGQRAEYRTAINQYLGVRTLQPVDAHLLEATVLAVILDTHAGLEVQAVGQRGSMGRLENFRVEHVHQRGGKAARRLVPVRRNHDTVERDGIFFDAEVYLQGSSLLQIHFSLLGLVSDGLHDEGKGSLGQVLQEIMACCVGDGSNGCPLKINIDIGQVFPTLLVEDMTDYVGIRRIQVRLVGSAGLCARQYDAQAYH